MEETVLRLHLQDTSGSRPLWGGRAAVWLLVGYVFLHLGLFSSLGNLKSKMHVSSCLLCIKAKMYNIIQHART